MAIEFDIPTLKVNDENHLFTDAINRPFGKTDLTF